MEVEVWAREKDGAIKTIERIKMKDSFFSLEIIEVVSEKI